MKPSDPAIPPSPTPETPAPARLGDVEVVPDAESDLDAMLAGLPGSVWESVIDTPGGLPRVTRISASVERMLGYSVAEWLNDATLMQRIVHPDDQPLMVEAAMNAIGSREHFVCQQRFYHRNGRLRWMEVRFRALYDAEGRHTGFRGVTVDITERKQAEEALRESEERFRRLVETSLEGIWIVDGCGNTTYVNQRMADLMGYAPEEITGRPVTDFIEEGVEDLLSVQWSAHDWDARHQREVRLRHRSGATVHTIAAVNPRFSPDGVFLGAVGMVTDVTAQKQVEEALRRSERLHRTLTENATDLICRLDRDGRYLYANPVIRDLLGLTPEEVVGRRMADLGLSQERIAFWEATLEQVFQGEQQNIEFGYDTLKGRRYYQALITPDYDEDGSVPSVLSICRDVTERRAAEEKQRFLAEAGAIVSSSLDFDVTMESITRLVVPYLADCCTVDIVDEEGVYHRVAVAHVDPKKEKLVWELRTRYPYTTDMNFSVPYVVKTGIPYLANESNDRWWRAVAQDEEELRLLREVDLRSGIIVPLAARGRRIGAMTLFVAGSQRQYTPEDLALAEELANRCALAMDNARLYEEVRKMNRAKDEFLAMLGHELRNPLAAISNALQAVRQGAVPSYTAVQDEVDREIFHMTRLVGDLLDVARITRGQIQLRCELVDANTAMEAAVRAMRPLTEARQHTVSVQASVAPAVVTADPVRLHQVLCNLLHNAAKYTPPGGRIRLSVRTEEGRVTFACADNGIGIPAEVLPVVFNVFEQAERNLDRAEGGLGIGLTLVQRLVELHGGTVEARSDGPGAGSEFLVRLPAATEGTREATRPARAEAILPDGAPEMSPDDGADESSDPVPEGESTRGRRILVVDDNAFSSRMLAQVLEMHGHAVSLAFDGPEALSAARNAPPDVVLLDIGLPSMDGFTVARQFQADPLLRHAVLVAVTGYGRDEDRERSREAGFRHHLVKPVDFDALNALLSQILDGSAADGPA